MPSPDASFSIARNTRASSDPAECPSPAPTGHRAEDPLALGFLADIASGLATVEDLWRPFLHHDLQERPATKLMTAQRWEAWLLEWDAGQSVELHDHGPSAGAFTVVLGRLVEVRAPRTGPVIRREVAAGQSRSFLAGARHDVLNLTASPAASIHVYSPPLRSMTFFDPITYQPLRTEPVEPAPAALLGDPAPLLHPSLARPQRPTGCEASGRR